MPKYRVRLETFTSATTEIEADSKQEAADAALDLYPRWQIPEGVTVDEAVEEIEG